MACYGGWAARRSRVPHVITRHGGRCCAGRLRRQVALRAAAGLSGGIVAVSQALAGQLSRDLWIRSTRSTTIPNGVRFDPLAESTIRSELALSPEDHLVVTVGHLYPVKGHRVLPAAAALPSSPRAQPHVAS